MNETDWFTLRRHHESLNGLRNLRVRHLIRRLLPLVLGVSVRPRLEEHPPDLQVAVLARHVQGRVLVGVARVQVQLVRILKEQADNSEGRGSRW